MVSNTRMKSHAVWVRFKQAARAPDHAATSPVSSVLGYDAT